MEQTVCTNHPDLEASRRCTRCLRPFCEHCLVLLGGRMFCADCKVEHLRDAESGLPTGALHYASLGRRFIALMIDSFIIGIPMMVLLLGVGFKEIFVEDRVPPWLNFIGFIQIPIFLVYEALLTRRNGQTLGKKWLGIRVVGANGQPITSGQAWGRGAMRGVMLSCLALINYLPAFFTPERTALHDMAASTRVVSAE